MKKIMSSVLAAISAAFMLTACGGSDYDFTVTELSEAIGVEKAVFDNMETQPVNNGNTDNKLMEQAKLMTGSNFYTYLFEHDSSGESFDIVQIDFAAGKVCTVTSSVYGEEKSKYSVMGIYAGDDAENVMSRLSEYYGEDGTALSDNKDLWELTDMLVDTVTYGDSTKSKGSVTIQIDVESNTILQVEFSKF